MDGARISRWLIPAVLILGMAVSLAPGVLAQPVLRSSAHEGDEFWLIFQPAFWDPQPGPPDLGVAISGSAGTEGVVSVPGQGVSLPFTIPAAGVIHVPLTFSDVFLTTEDGVEPRGVHITASAAVSVTGYDANLWTLGAFQGLAVGGLGTDYLVLDYTTFPPLNINWILPSQFSVVAIADDTTVTIIPTTTVGDREAGVPYEIVLDAGDVYRLAVPGPVAEPVSLTGTAVTADKPVALFAGHMCAWIPDQDTTACDHITEQLPPVNAWGQTFLTMPLARNTPGDIFRILAAADGTIVTINGAEEITLQRGEYHQQALTSPAAISASHPVLVAQYALGSNADFTLEADPLMMLIPPVEGFLTEYRFPSLASRMASTEYVHVIAPVDATGSVTLNSVPIPENLFTPIGSSGYAGAQVTLPGMEDALHTITSNVPIGVAVYGWSIDSGYGYPAAWGLLAVASLTMTPAEATVAVGAEHCVVATALDAADDPLAGVEVGFEVGGLHPATGMDVTDESGEARFCYTGTMDGTDMIEATHGKVSASASVTWNLFSGMAAGSGVIMSPRGAVAAAPTAINRAIFSFAVSYPEGASTPTGPVSFTYSHGTFSATSLDVLLINGSDITIQGSGTLNGSGDYAFTLSAVDGSPDGFRIQIRDGATVVYDNGSVQPLLGGLVMIRP